MARYTVVAKVIQVMDDPSLTTGEAAVTQALANITLATTQSTARSKGSAQVFGATSNPPLSQQASGAGAAEPAPVIVEGEKGAQ